MILLLSLSSTTTTTATRRIILSSTRTRTRTISSTRTTNFTNVTSKLDDNNDMNSNIIFPFMEPIHILGSGSIGLFWAASIRSAFPSFPIVALLRKQQSKQQQQQDSSNDSMSSSSSSTTTTTTKRKKKNEMTICLMQHQNNKSNKQQQSQPKQRLRPRLVSVPYQYIDNDDHYNHYNNYHRPIQNIILSTKAFQAKDAMMSILPRLKANDNQNDNNRNNNTPIRIFILCNGALDVRETLVKEVFSNPQVLQQYQFLQEQRIQIIMCMTTHGIVREIQSSSSNSNFTSSSSFLNDDDDDDDDIMYHITHVGQGQAYIGGSSTSIIIGSKCSSSHDTDIDNDIDKTDTDRNAILSMAKLWDQSGLNTTVVDDDYDIENNNNNNNNNQKMEAMLWQKLAANCVCNPLTTLWNVPNGKLCNHSNFDSLRKDIVTEISQIAAKEVLVQQKQQQQIQQQQQNDMAYNNNNTSYFFLQSTTPTALNEFVEQVIQENYHNKSSMYYDIVQHGRNTTEIHNLNGYIVKKGMEYNIPTPANFQLTQQILELSRQKKEMMIQLSN